RLAVGRRRINRLSSRVDRPEGDLRVFGPVRDQTPAQRVQATLLGFRIVPDSEDVLARSDVPTNRQVPLRRNRDMVTPRQFFLCCGSTIATAHGGTIRRAEWRSKSSRGTGVARYPVQSAQERGTRSRI